MKYTIQLFALLLLGTYAQAQVTNLDFETWDTGSNAKPYPRGWPSLADNYCLRSEHPYQGSYALTTGVWYYYVKTSAVQRQAIGYNPSSLEGYYTYTDNMIIPISSSSAVPDTALVAVYLTRMDSVHMRQDTIGQGIVELYGASSYTHFICPISYTGAGIADSITIILDPSTILRNVGIGSHTTGSRGFGSYFTTDALSLNGLATGITAPSETTAVTIYPNPASSCLNISVDQNGSYTVLISDMTGKTYLSTSVDGPSASLSITDLPSGMYLVRISDANGHAIATRKFVKK